MITAAAAGIGRAIAKVFYDEGAKVHICDVNEQALAAFREEFPEIAATHVNVANEAEVDAWFDEALEDLGGLDVLVNNAGIKGPTAPIDDVEYAGLLPVPLTTLRQPTRQIGDAALTTMLERVARRDLPARDILLHAELVVRESCGSRVR